LLLLTTTIAGALFGWLAAYLGSRFGAMVRVGEKVPA
jgi:hypothetical protein